MMSVEPPQLANTDTSTTQNLTPTNESEITIAYRPILAHLTDSTTAAILLQQAIYRAQQMERQSFYKFKAPCKHALYEEGDSWTEELGFSEREFDTALKVIGTKIMKGVSKQKALETNYPLRLENETDAQYSERFAIALRHCLIYWTDSSRITWYYVNFDLLGKFINAVYLDKSNSLRYLKTNKNAVTVNRKPADTYQNDKNADTSDSEITTKTSKITTKKKNISPVGDGAIFARYWSVLVKSKICEQVSRIPMPETKPETPLEPETPKPQKWRANDPQIQAAVADAFKVSVGGFAGTLAQQLLGQNSGKNTRRDKFLIEPGMSSPAEIVLFGGWYRDNYEFSPKPSTDAERIAELVAEFRSKPPHFFTNNLPRAEAKLRKLIGLPDPILEQIPNDPEYAARIERVYARIAALKGSLV